MKNNFMNMEVASEFLKTSIENLVEMTTNREIPHYINVEGDRIYFKKDELIEFFNLNVIPTSIEENSSTEQKCYLRFFLEKVDVI